LNQSATNGVGDDVAGSGLDVIVSTQSPIMKTGLPDTLTIHSDTKECATASGFECTHQTAQAALSEFDQPVQVIRHEYPSQGLASAFLLAQAKLLDNCPGETQVSEQWRAIAGSGRKQV
jgi:hypothetical protein